MFVKKTAVWTFIVILSSLALILAGCGALGSSPPPPRTEEATQKETDTTVNETTAETAAPLDPESILAPYRNQYGVVDKPAQDFELMDLDGNTVRLSDFRGKVVFLNFWATWCPPCREEMPHMQVFYDKHKDDDVVVLAVSPTTVELRGQNDSDRAMRQVRDFIEQGGFTFPVLLDKDDAVWAVYQQRGIPTNYVIDAEGTIRYLKLGAFMSVEEMEAFLKAARIVN